MPCNTTVKVCILTHQILLESQGMKHGGEYLQDLEAACQSSA